jgi:predicted DNA-binding protein
MRQEIRKKCCEDLKTYLETVLAGARGGVISIKPNRVLEVSGLYKWKKQYTRCLSRLLRRYRFSKVYVLTKQQAEELLNSLDALCENLDSGKISEKSRREAPSNDHKQKEPAALAGDREGMPMVSFHLPRALLQALDEYARRMNMTRSDVVRMAISQMLSKMYSEEAAEEEFEYITAV